MAKSQVTIEVNTTMRTINSNAWAAVGTNALKWDNNFLNVADGLFYFGNLRTTTTPLVTPGMADADSILLSDPPLTGEILNILGGALTGVISSGNLPTCSFAQITNAASTDAMRTTLPNTWKLAATGTAVLTGQTFLTLGNTNLPANFVGSVTLAAGSYWVSNYNIAGGTFAVDGVPNTNVDATVSILDFLNLTGGSISLTNNPNLNLSGTQTGGTVTWDSASASNVNGQGVTYSTPPTGGQNIFVEATDFASWLGYSGGLGASFSIDRGATFWYAPGTDPVAIAVGLARGKMVAGETGTFRVAPGY